METNYHIYETTKLEFRAGKEGHYSVLNIRKDNQELNIFLDDADRKRLINALEVK